MCVHHGEPFTANSNVIRPTIPTANSPVLEKSLASVGQETVMPAEVRQSRFSGCWMKVNGVDFKHVWCGVAMCHPNAENNTCEIDQDGGVVVRLGKTYNMATKAQVMSDTRCPAFSKKSAKSSLLIPRMTHLQPLGSNTS